MRKTSPAWSFRGRSSKSITLPVPGPGTYTPSQSNLESSPSFRIGKSNRLNSNSKFSEPGPANYTPKKPLSANPNTV